MRPAINLPKQFEVLAQALCFFKKHVVIILGLGLIAALGRVIQLGGFGAISPWLNITLEIVIESARILLFLFVLGLANVKTGLLRIKRLFTRKQQRKQHVTAALQTIKHHWLMILLNFFGFLVLASGINYLIDLLAYETCLYLKLKQNGILTAAASEWTILLFFKNLSVIPLTLIFEAVLLLWMINKWQVQTRSKLFY